MSTCKQCAVAADVFSDNVKNYGIDAALASGHPNVMYHNFCEYIDCYCQHTIDRVEYARD